MSKETGPDNYPDHLKFRLDLESDYSQSAYRTSLRNRIKNSASKKAMSEPDKKQLASILKFSIQMLESP